MMRILEVRDSFIKFETDERISISSFLQINDAEKRYIAQVIQTKRADEINIAFAKILFLYDGTLRNYDKSLPSKNAEISEFTFDILSKSLNYNTPIISGKFIDNGIDIPMDKDCFNKKMFISVDTPKSNNRIVSNLKKQFSYLGKVLVIDMLGIVEGQKYVAGVDFKLPLNTESLKFMFEDCLNDATADSKNLIKEIFTDLAEYSASVPFLPFDALKSIVDDMVDKQHIFKLLVLKNKLAKFAQQGYFAATATDAQNLNKILQENDVVIDLSKLDTTFQNRYLEAIYSLLNNETQVFLEVSNSINKKNTKNILENEAVSSVFITHSKFKYINEIKTLFDNFIIEPSFTNNEVFKIYSAFLNSMPKETYLLVGDGTNYIPLVSSLDAIINIPELPAEKPTVIEEPEEITISEEDLGSDEKPEEPETPVVEEKEIFIENIIQQKANELINKLTEEMPAENSNNLFTEEDEESEPEETELLLEEPQPLEYIEEITEEITEEISEDSLSSFSGESDFHTEVSEAKAMDISEETTEEKFELEPEEELPAEQEEDITNIEKELNPEDGFKEEEKFEETEESEEIQTIEIPENISDLTDEIELEAVEPELELEPEAEPQTDDSFAETIDSEPLSEEFKEYSEENNSEQEVVSLDENNSLDEIVELDESEIGEDIILVDFDDEEPLSEEDLDKQIVDDVDKVFTTMKEDTISDSDLDFIDELNSEENEELEEISGSIEELPESFGDDEQEEYEFPETLEGQNEIVLEEELEDEILETKNTKTPIVPVYDAEIPQEDIVMSDPIEQGDLVVHAKYGTGTVEKMIKYGTKTLFSINFDNVGRRLLDPTLTEIKRA